MSVEKIKKYELEEGYAYVYQNYNGQLIFVIAKAKEVDLREISRQELAYLAYFYKKLKGIEEIEERFDIRFSLLDLYRAVKRYHANDEDKHVMISEAILKRLEEIDRIESNR